MASTPTLIQAGEPVHLSRVAHPLRRAIRDGHAGSTRDLHYPHLRVHGEPVRIPSQSHEDFRAVHAICRAHSENFSVLSHLVPKGLRDGFAAVYAFCRVSDDIADEGGSTPEARDIALRNLAVWRTQLHACASGGDLAKAHPLFPALRITMSRYKMPMKPFDDLLDAFEQDQRITRYETVDQLVAYSSQSANPVGHLVLMLAGLRPPNEIASNTARYEWSDATCTALQLTNFWQDVRRDLVERDRIYLPLTQMRMSEQQIRAMVAGDTSALLCAQYESAIAPLIESTRTMFTTGDALPQSLPPSDQPSVDAGIAPVIRLFSAGGRSVLTSVERAGARTLLVRPRLSAVRKASILFRESTNVLLTRLRLGSGS